MIFAAGLGTRLKPLTDHMPKALVPVAGKPMLEHVIEKLKASGVNEVVINVHHFANQIIDFLKAKDNFGIRIWISDETDELLDTGGGIQKASCYLNEPFLVHNADILSLWYCEGNHQRERTQHRGARDCSRCENQD